ncbi:hypothetical protein AB0O34_34590 [Sphaerisporangium sp. NPDC088356]|uniref:hypothetical protein n=1 Tax=Sphaerisporangium sp. NPDC088356 TaxID=3154871 RepID=UPI0034260D6C
MGALALPERTLPTGSAPQSPEERIQYLDGRLSAQIGKVEKYGRYYDSRNTPPAFAQQRFEEAFGAMFTQWKVNFGGLIVDSISERIKVEGFRMTEDPDADRDAWEIWQKNCMDAESNAAHIDSLALSRSYAVVWETGARSQILIEATSMVDALAFVGA